MKIGIIDVGWKALDIEHLDRVALGGSETWLVQIANEFSKYAETDVYCKCKGTHKRGDVFYTSIDTFLENTKQYDFIILNRFFIKNGKNYIDYIKTNERAKHVYIQLHDLSFTIDGTLLERGVDVNQYGLNDDFVTVITLNEWHRSNLLAQYPMLKDPICIPNGLDLSLFNEYTGERDNRVLWSSCAERGLDILLNDIYPIVKDAVPDFGVDIAGYNDFSIDGTRKDIRYLGKLSKDELYKEQSKHKVWFYPGTFAETFCITMLENIMNGCQIVSPLTYGTDSTIGYADVIRMKHTFRDDYEAAVHEAATKIIDILKGDTLKSPVYILIKDKITAEYNWEHSVELYLSHYKSINYKIKPVKDYRQVSLNKQVLILTMCCNNSHFQSLLAVEKDTWIKPILHNEYANCVWFGYTACDKRHPQPCIDWNDHMVYVDSGDDLFSTYDKTVKAYKMIVDAGVQFDYVVRTNTSVYINLSRLFDMVNNAHEDEIYGGICGYYHKFSDGHREFKWNIVPGLFMGMYRSVFDVAMSATNNYDTIPTSDDVIMSGVIFEKLPNIKVISPNGDFPDVYPRYKACLPEDAQKYANVRNLVWNADIINQSVAVQIRTLYGDLPERTEKGHELEHFYEIFDAID